MRNIPFIAGRIVLVGLFLLTGRAASASVIFPQEESSVANLAKPPSGCRFHPRCPYAMAICSKEKPAMLEITPGHSVACHLYTEVAK